MAQEDVDMADDTVQAITEQSAADGITNITPTASTITDAQWDAIDSILTKVYAHRSEDGHDPSKVFHKKVNKRIVPDYYDVIKEPVALSTIKANLMHHSYKAFPEFVRDFALIPHNAQVYNRPGAGAYHDALEVKTLFESELQKLVDSGVVTGEDAKLPDLGEIPEEEEIIVGEDEEEDDDDDGDESDASTKAKRGPGRPRKSLKREDSADAAQAAEIDPRKKRGRPPKVETPAESRIRNIMKYMRRPKNPAGHHYIDHFESLPDRTAMPEYYAEIKQPIALDTIKKKIKRKKYNTVEQFMVDVNLMLDNAKAYNQEDSIIYKDAMALQQEAQMAARNEIAKPDTDFAAEDGRVPLPNGVDHDGQIYKVGDWVHILNPNNLQKPIPTQIYRTWKDEHGSQFVNACWYYRPEQTVHRFDKHFFEQEIVKTGQYRDHSVDEIVDRCFVMFITRYNKGRPRGFPADKQVYVCESRYNLDKHTFNKIKTWASCLPDEVRDKDYEMDLFPQPKRMKKKPSPIAYLLKDEQKETDELPEPTWGGDNAPPSIGAVHRRPRDLRDSPPPERTPTPPPKLPTPQPPPAQAMAQSLPNGVPRMQPNGLPQNYPPRLPPNAAPLVQFPNSTSHHAASPMNQLRAAPSLNRNYSSQMSSASQVNQTHANAGTASSPHQYSSQTQNYTRPGTSSAYSSAQQNAYAAPQAIEVYHLPDGLDNTIPRDIACQFQRDSEGRVLFFTAPPLNIRSKAEKSNEDLGHSANYLALRFAKETERKRKLAEREEVESQQLAENESKRQKLLTQTRKDQAEVEDSALQAWRNQVTRATEAEFENLYGREIWRQAMYHIQELARRSLAA